MGLLPYIRKGIEWLSVNRHLGQRRLNRAYSRGEIADGDVFEVSFRRGFSSGCSCDARVSVKKQTMAFPTLNYTRFRMVLN